MDLDAIGREPEKVFQHFESGVDGAGEIKAVLAAFCSNPQSRLLRVILGDVELYPSGHLHWNFDEELQLSDALAGDLTGIRDDIADNLDRFDSRPEPEVYLGLNDDDEAIGVDIGDNENDIEGPDQEEGNESSNAS
ncbi:hypothetical protein [Dactylosporangium sp. NPDC048998]|uniref:hypothetical protein n=1 Tax=Dactylosporangium sp. NPDC048998 TaxID=3363976 RepID=UPI0037179E73